VENHVHYLCLSVDKTLQAKDFSGFYKTLKKLFQTQKNSVKKSRDMPIKQCNLGYPVLQRILLPVVAKKNRYNSTKIKLNS